MLSLKLKDCYVGDEANEKRGLLTNKYPIENGVITNWDDIEKLWHYTFHEGLAVKPEEHPLLLTEAPLNARINREKITEAMFEGYQVPALYLAPQAVLALYSTGRTTGVVLDSSEDVSYTIPIYEGHAITHAIPHMFIAGRDVTDSFHKALENKYMWISNERGLRRAIREMKEEVGYVALDYEEEMTRAESVKKTYDFKYAGEELTLGSECFECPEGLFKPSLIRCDCEGIHETVHNSVQKCDADIRRDLYSNIVISGENMRYHGMAERLQKEITALAPPTEEVKVITPPDCRSAAWLGGSMLASTPTFIDMCISKEEYDEFGPVIVFRKCF